MLGVALKAFARGKQVVPAMAAAPSAASLAFSGTYDDAMRHSRRVRFLRKAIPTACIAAIIGPIAWGIVASFARTGLDVKVGPISVSGSKITMEAPKLSGFKKDLKAYEVTATSAVQDLKQPSVVELNDLKARMEQDDKKFARLTSEWGRFDQTADRLDLKGTVRVRTDNGQEADMLSARVNIKSGDLVSEEPVTVRSLTGTVSADRMEVRDNGKHAIFEGRVRSVFIHNEEPSTAQPQAKAP
jgi:lipopolysaccharide export system protein LptC